MLAWAFPCESVDELGSLLRALGKHRYLAEADHRVHWAVDAALSDHEPFKAHARAFTDRKKRERDLDPSSYDPTLWRSATADEVVEIFRLFWTPGPAATAAASRLRALIEHEGLVIPEREPFEGDPESPDHPQLIQLSWRLLPVADLDPDRHAGAIKAMAEAGEEVDVSAPIDQEGPDLGVLELIEGADDGVPLSELLIWADGPRSYNDYVFRGACKAAKLPWMPEGPDGDDEGDEEALISRLFERIRRALTGRPRWVDCRPLENGACLWAPDSTFRSRCRRLTSSSARGAKPPVTRPLPPR